MIPRVQRAAREIVTHIEELTSQLDPGEFGVKQDLVPAIYCVLHSTIHKIMHKIRESAPLRDALIELNRPGLLLRVGRYSEGSRWSRFTPVIHELDGDGPLFEQLARDLKRGILEGSSARFE